MNSITRPFRLLSSLAAIALMVGLLAQPVQADHRGNIIQTLEKDGRFTTLLAALEATDLTETVATAGPFTLFAPTDEAFGKLPEGTVASLITMPDVLKSILLYHVVGGNNSLWSLLSETSVETLQGDPVLVQRGSNWSVTVNNTKISGFSWASNGYIYVIDGVLLPPEEPVSIDSLVDVLALDGRFTTLLTALNVTGLDEVVAAADSLTIFAPTDDAFAALPDGTVEFLIDNPEALANILTYHVLGQEATAYHLLRMRTATTLQGADVKISLSRQGFLINDAKVVSANISAPNGIIHAINKVLLPPAAVDNVVELLEQDGRFTTLLAAVKAAELDGVLASGGPFTIFAPTDRAFAALPEGTVAALLNDIPALTDILLYHVVSGAKDASQLLEERSVETLQGSNVEIRKFFSWVFVNKSLVIDANLQSPNATVHAISRVLLP